MAEFAINEDDFQNLKGKVVIISGGSTGIGAAIVARLYNNGAKIIIGDTNTTAGQTLITNLQKSSSSSSPTQGELTFQKCDVTIYSDLYALFTTARTKYPTGIDHAVACAGIFEQQDKKWFDPELTVESVGLVEGDHKVLDVNVIGTANFARIAAVFLRDGNEDGNKDKSLTLLSSVNAFRESPGLFMYQTSKHAVQGLFRSSRTPLFTNFHIRLNTVNPGVTDTPMTLGIVEKFRDAGLYWQPADAVARVVLAFMVRTEVHGKGVYVEGGGAWEFEEGFVREQPAWLGEEATRRMRVNSEAVNKGALNR